MIRQKCLNFLIPKEQTAKEGVWPEGIELEGETELVSRIQWMYSMKETFLLQLPPLHCLSDFGSGVSIEGSYKMQKK